MNGKIDPMFFNNEMRNITSSLLQCLQQIRSEIEILYTSMNKYFDYEAGIKKTVELSSKISIKLTPTFKTTRISLTSLEKLEKQVEERVLNWGSGLLEQWQNGLKEQKGNIAAQLSEKTKDVDIQNQ